MFIESMYLEDVEDSKNPLHSFLICYISWYQ